MIINSIKTQKLNSIIKFNLKYNKNLNLNEMKIFYSKCDEFKIETILNFLIENCIEKIIFKFYLKKYKSKRMESLHQFLDEIIKV